MLWIVTGKTWLPGPRAGGVGMTGANGLFCLTCRIGRTIRAVAELVAVLLASLDSKQTLPGSATAVAVAAGHQEEARAAAAGDVEWQADDADAGVGLAGERRARGGVHQVDFAWQPEREVDPVAGRAAAVARGHRVEEGFGEAHAHAAVDDGRDGKVGPRVAWLGEGGGGGSDERQDGENGGLHRHYFRLSQPPR